MRALSVRQPFAGAIVLGWKPVENRKVAWGYVGKLLIHAGLRYAGPEAYVTVERLADTRVPAPGAPNADLVWSFGAIIGVVDVVGTHRSGECGTTQGRGCSPWAEPFSAHMELANPRRLRIPVECPGRQGLWIPEPHILAAAKKQLEAA